MTIDVYKHKYMCMVSHVEVNARPMLPMVCCSKDQHHKPITSLININWRTCYNSTRNEQAYTSCKYEQVSNKLTIFINRMGQGTENYTHKYGVNSTLLHNVDVACRSLRCSTGNPI